MQFGRRKWARRQTKTLSPAALLRWHQSSTLSSNLVHVHNVGPPETNYERISLRTAVSTMANIPGQPWDPTRKIPRDVEHRFHWATQKDVYRQRVWALRPAEEKYKRSLPQTDQVPFKIHAPTFKVNHWLKKEEICKLFSPCYLTQFLIADLVTSDEIIRRWDENPEHQEKLRSGFLPPILRKIQSPYREFLEENENLACDFSGDDATRNRQLFFLGYQIHRLGRDLSGSCSSFFMFLINTDLWRWTSWSPHRSLGKAERRFEGRNTCGQCHPVDAGPARRGGDQSEISRTVQTRTTHY